MRNDDVHLRTLSAAADPAEFLDAFTALPSRVRRDPYRVGLASPGAAKWMLGLGLSPHREAWLATREGRVIGRVHANTSWSRDVVGYIGFYEVDLGEADHALVARALLEAAEGWLRERGVREIYGPVDWCTWFSYRLLMPETPEQPHGRLCAWEPVTPPEFLAHWESAGFEVFELYHSTPMLHAPEATLAATAEAMRPAYEGAIAAGFTFRNLAAGAALVEESRDLYDVNMRGFAGNTLFEPIPFEVYRATIGALAATFDPAMSFWVHAPTGEPVAYLYSFQDGDYYVGKTLVVVPEYRNRALIPATGHLSLTVAAARGIPTIVRALVREGNKSDRLVRSADAHATTPWRHAYALLAKNA
jgi:hypothetical protein